MAQSALRAEGGGIRLNSIMSHLSLAKQRFESFADPAAQMALMILPITALLAYISSDVRGDSARRKRAVHVLKLLTPEFCIMLGVSADYGLIATNFIRLYDALNHDIARSAAELEWFEQTLDAFFKKGRLLGRTSVVSAANGGRGTFITDAVRHQMTSPITARAGGQLLLVGGPCPSKKLERIAKRTHVVVDQASARLRADFAADLVRGEFRCFDLPQMRAAVASKDPNAARKAIYKQAVNLAAAAKLCQGSVALDFKETESVVEGSAQSD